jgi:hypothetical protein
MTDYGVVVSGFARKPLTVILGEIEQSNIDIFGPGLVQTSQTPMGQLNGLRADVLSAAWEMFEDVYQSYDPDQAEGTRLDILSRLRLVTRATDETDESLRQAITNLGVPNTRDADFYRAIINVDGVTWAKIYSNDTGSTDANGIAAHSVSVAVIGGDDVEVALAARQYIVPGISTYGNTMVSTEIAGFCRSIQIMRPEQIAIFLNVTVSKSNDAAGCPPPSNAAIAQTLYAGLTGDNRPANGQDITLHMLRTISSCVYPNVEVTAATGNRVGNVAAALPIAIDFDEMAAIALNVVAITAV